jgi:hypothetical protein
MEERQQVLRRQSGIDVKTRSPSTPSLSLRLAFALPEFQKLD